MIITRSHKNLGLAILLTLVFGPLGLLYASIAGGLIMTFTPILLGLLFIVGLFQDNPALAGLSGGLFIVFILTYWLINIIWAVVAVKDFNSQVDEDAKRELEIWARVHSKEEPKVVVNISQKSNSSDQERVTTNEKPSLQDWLRSNPGKSINDYFSRFGR